MAKKLYEVKDARWDADIDEAPEYKDDVLYIEKSQTRICMDMMIGCKRDRTAYSRFRKAVEQAAAAGVFGDYDVIADMMFVETQDFNAEFNNPMTVHYNGCMKDLGFVFSSEWPDEETCYVWLNITTDRMNQWIEEHRKVA